MVLKSSIRSSALPRPAPVRLVFGTLTMWFENRVYVARLRLAKQRSDWASGTLNMIKIGSGTGRDADADADADDAVRTDRRECRNSYVDL